ncbi:hypothetical protein ACYSNR_08445 [Enterococcus sp. LJL128]
MSKYLNDIKLRINPFGHSKWKERISIRWARYDGYLWSVIEEIEGKLADPNFDLEKYKRDLVYCISLLLKLDWERSKNEIKGNSNKWITYGVVLITWMITFIFLGDSIKSILTSTIDKNIPSIMAVAVLFFVPFFVRLYSYEIDDTIKDIFITLFLVVLLPVASNVVLCTYASGYHLSIGEMIILIILYIVIFILVAFEIGNTYYGKIQNFFK